MSVEMYAFVFRNGVVRVNSKVHPDASPLCSGDARSVLTAVKKYCTFCMDVGGYKLPKMAAFETDAEASDFVDEVAKQMLQDIHCAVTTYRFDKEEEQIVAMEVA